MGDFKLRRYKWCGKWPVIDPDVESRERTLITERDNLLEELDGAVKLREAADAWITKVEAERDRYKKALETISNTSCPADAVGAITTVSRIWQLADTALSPDQP